MLRTTAVDIALFTSSVALFIAYHLWLFTWDARACVRARDACCGRGARLTPAAGRMRVSAEAASNRRAWVRAVVADASSGGQTYAVQVIRSHIMAATLLATTCGLIAIQGMLPALLDAGRLRRLRELASHDPIAPGVEGRWPSEGVKLALLEAAVLAAMVCLMQSIRFNVHAGFALKVAAGGPSMWAPGGGGGNGGGAPGGPSASPPGASPPTSYAASEALALLDRAAGAFTAGQRCFYAFLPLFMSLFGPTVMFIATVALVAGLYVLDVLPLPGVGLAASGGGGGVADGTDGFKEPRAVV
jgi:hypothetical protein